MEKCDLKYNNEKLIQDGQAFMDSFKAQMESLVNNTLGEAYANLMPYIETDTWTNYREALRIELQHEYKYSNFKQPWATDFRRAVFVENREEISKLIEADILKRIKHLEDCRQECDQFRYSPGGDRYQDLKAENVKLTSDRAILVEALEFYAEDTNYEEDLNRHSTRLVSQVSLDEGKRARKALSEINGDGEK